MDGYNVFYCFFTKIIIKDILDWFINESNIYKEMSLFNETFKNNILYELRNFDKFPDRVLLGDIVEESFPR